MTDGIRPENGAALLDDLHAALTRYVAFPSRHASVATTLWIAATHALPAFECAPRLVFTSPQKRCGKTRALDIITATCHDPLVTVNATVAAVFRSLGNEHDHPPTMIIDEVDAIFGNKKTAEQHEDLRALINAGHQRGRPVLRCFGPNHQVAMFDTFAMAVLAGIGVLPDTITDRAVNIHMRRRAAGERVSQFRLRRDTPVLETLRVRLASWTAPLIDDLSKAEPDMPVEDRAADTWEPLMAIADAAGGDWPDWAQTACAVMVASADDADENQSLGIRLLADIRGVFAAQARSFVSSSVLVEALRDVEDSPWKDFDLTARKLAYRLAPFGVKPRPDTKGDIRGYRLEDLVDGFSRYLRQDPSDPSETTSEQGKPSDTSEASDTSKCQTETKCQTKTAGQTPFLTDLTGSDGPLGGDEPPTAAPSGDGQCGDGCWPPCYVCGDPIPSKEMAVVRGQRVHDLCRSGAAQ